jgi:hypothetical protein
MDVLSVLRLLGRHWRVTAPVALLTLLGLVAAFQFSSPTYEATGSVVLLSPPEPPEVNDLPEGAPAPDVGQNPFARYGDLAVVSDILARVMDSDSKRAEFESEGVIGYEVVANRLERGPVVDVTGQGTDSEAAIRSTEIVLKEVNAILLELQQAEGADPEYFINSAPLEAPSTASAMYGSTMRAAIAVLAVGTLGALGVAVLAEAYARRRTARLTAEAGAITDAASLGTQRGASNGSRRTSWSGILPALRLARGEPSKRETTQQESSQQESSKQEPASRESSAEEPVRRKAVDRESSAEEPVRRKGLDRETSKQEPSWQKTFQQASCKQESSVHRPSIELRADNGHRRPTTDRSP